MLIINLLKKAGYLTPVFALVCAILMMKNHRLLMRVSVISQVSTQIVVDTFILMLVSHSNFDYEM